MLVIKRFDTRSGYIKFVIPRSNEHRVDGNEHLIL